MLKMSDTRSRYFSVAHSTRILGAHYVPSVCYPLSQGLEAVVEEMAAKGMARIYPEKVRFVTGVPYPVKMPETETAASQPSFAPVPGTPPAVKLEGKPPAAAEKQGVKLGRSASASQRSREFD